MAPDMGLIEHRLSAVERAVEKIAEAVQVIAMNTTQIAQLEVRHTETRDGLTRAFDEIEKLQAGDVKADERLKLIEVEMPGLKETRNWVTRAMVGVVGFVGLAVIGLVVLK